MDLSENLFLSCNSIFLFFNQAILDALNLCSNRVQVIIMIFNAVFSFFMYHFFQAIPTIA